MFLELLRKEFIETKSREKKSKIGSIISYSLYAVLLIGIVALECFIVLSLDKKIQAYSSFGSFDFLVLVLMILMLTSALFAMLKARKIIFSSDDNNITTRLPISSSTIILAKVAYVYISTFLFNFLTAVPILICYGATRHFIPYYYVYSILYPIIISFFATGISLIFTIIYQYVYSLVKKSDIAQFIVASVLMILLCYVYKTVLDMFLTALNDSSIGGMFSMSFVQGLHKMRRFCFPTFYMLEPVIEQKQIASGILITIGSIMISLILGISLISVVYLKFIKKENSNTVKSVKNTSTKLVSPFVALLKKEMSLLFKDETNVFSYTSLLILCPFLTYAVISSLNAIIYDNLRFYASYFPELISGINLALVLLFIGVINASASSSISREKKALLVMKTIPLSLDQQIIAKTLVPVILSSISLFITDLVLFITKEITTSVFFTSLIIAVIGNVFYNLFGLYSEMKDRRATRKMKMSVVLDILPIAIPLLLFLVLFLLSIFTKISGSLIYVILVFISLLIYVPLFLVAFFDRRNAFDQMEVST